jgi:hypothetical protein
MIEPDRLLEGMLRTLETSVLPALDSGFARGQLFAVLEVLGSMQGQVTWGGAMLENERDALDALVAEAASAVGANDADLAGRLRSHADRRFVSLDERLREGRRLVCELIERGHADAGPIADSVRGYLCNDAISKAMALRPGRLAEISHG